MNRNQLALFHAVAEAGGISRGAEKAHVSQPAVSKQIADLEKALGVSLLERLPRGCRLTEAGAILAEHAARWLWAEREAERAMADYAGLKRGRLALGASQTVGAYLLPRVMAAFHRAHPGIELQIEIANTRQIQQALLDGAIDIGLTEGPLDSDELETTVFYHDRIIAVAPAGHPLLQKKAVRLRDVANEPLILREEGSGTRAVVERALRAKKLPVKPLLSLASPEAIKHMVEAGLGVALVSELIVATELRNETLGVIPVSDVVLERTMHRQRVRHRLESPATKQFIAILESTFPAADRGGSASTAGKR